jgi:ribosomal-protein-alanine N-acetyltransferase
MPKAANNFPTLTTRRLKLRHFEPRDVEGLHDCLGNAEAMRYWNVPASKTLAETQKVPLWLAKTSSPYDHLAWAVADRGTDRCIGMVSYHHREAGNRRLEIGYCIAPGHQRRGFATEAVGAVIGYCTGTLGVHRIEAMIHTENVASMRLVERLGFRCEGGPLRDYWCVGGRYASVMVYALVDGGDARPLKA